MKELGRIVQLKVLKRMSKGYILLASNDAEVFLPLKYAKNEYKERQKISVYVYLDADNKLIATTKEPYITLNEVVRLKAVDVNNHGAFFDIGIEKDLFVPYSEQKDEIEVGRYYFVYMYKDEKSGRLTGSTKINKFINNYEVYIKPREEVDVLVYRDLGEGYVVVVNNMNFGMIYKNELFLTVNIGDKLTGFVSRINEDNKVDITLNSAAIEELEGLAGIIYKRLQKEKVLSLSDKSAPELIYKEFKVSKKSFKKAIGMLYKKRKIIINKTNIQLTNK